MLEYTLPEGRLETRMETDRRRISIALLVLFLFLGLGCGPVLLVPGGELTGEVTPLPSDWSFTDDISTVQIETRPSDPYSVNIWITRVDDLLYLHAGANRATWIEALEADPRLRVRIDEKIYELRASRVEDATTFAAFADAYEGKYGVRPRNESVSEVYLMRLEPR